MSIAAAGLHPLIATKRDASKTIDSLKLHFGDRLSVTEAMREQHGYRYPGEPDYAPDAVVFVQSEAEVQRVVAACAQHHTPIIPFAAGTSMEGQFAPVMGGISLDLTGMNRILEVHADDFDVVVEPGVTRMQLNNEIRNMGLFFPIDPGADATLGGMASTRASGTNAVRYGTMRENVLALRVVTPDGRVVTTGSRSKKSSTGYDLTRLFVGSEGTLGVITEATIRLHPIPEHTAVAVCPFASLEGAVRTVIETIQYGIPIARIELLDDVSITATNNFFHLELEVAPTLFLEFHGSPGSVAEQTAVVGEIAVANGGGGFEWSPHKEDRERLWKARHNSQSTGRAMRPGCILYTTDICVPISRLADSILAARADIDAAGLVGRILGHVGDGNFHVGLSIMPGDPVEFEKAEQFADRLAERAIAVGGTVSGEHGIGLRKLKYLRPEHGDAAVDMMRTLKAALDPGNIMNPGKMADWAEPAGAAGR